MQDGLKIAIWQEPPFGSVCVAIYYELADKIQIAKPVDLIFETYDQGALPEATIRIGHFAAKSFLTGLAEELDHLGVKTERDAKLEGTLEATRLHLDDSRWLVKELMKRIG